MRAAMLGGGVAGLVAPPAWLVVLFLDPSLETADVSTMIQGLVLVAVVALVVGLAVGLVVGVPLLSVLSLLGISHPFVPALAGALIALPISLAFFHWPEISMSIVAFATMVGGAAGWVAGRSLGKISAL